MRFQSTSQRLFFFTTEKFTFGDGLFFDHFQRGGEEGGEGGFARTILRHAPTPPRPPPTRTAGAPLLATPE